MLFRASNFVLGKFLNNMSNLLPKETLRFVWEGYRSRLILTGALVLVAAAALAFMELLPSYAAIKVEERSREKQSSLPERPDTDPQAEAERKELMRAQALLARALPIVSAASAPSEVIKAALALRPPGVTVSKIFFVSGESGALTLTGNSAGREGVNQYREALSKEKYFRSVSVPVGALVGSEGSEFTITLTGDF